MDSHYMHFRKPFIRLLASTILCLICLACFSQRTKYGAQTTSDAEISGLYQKVNGSELLFLNKDKTFVCIRNHINKSDVVIPSCDTLGRGEWNLKGGFIMLKNNDYFNKTDYSIRESEMKSKDSVYFKIVLPEDDALSYNNFRFSIITTPIYRRFEQTGKSEFAITNKQWKNGPFGFVIQNLTPNVDYGMKSYQRVYFNVFDSYTPANSNANYFTIVVRNFNQCFYEAMDLDGEIIGIDNHVLLWRGNTYRKIK